MEHSSSFSRLLNIAIDKLFLYYLFYFLFFLFISTFVVKNKNYIQFKNELIH